MRNDASVNVRDHAPTTIYFLGPELLTIPFSRRIRGYCEIGRYKPQACQHSPIEHLARRCCSHSNCQINQAFAGIVWTDYPSEPEMVGKSILFEACEIVMTVVLNC